MPFEVWAKPPGRRHRVRIRVYPDSLWQVACWTATVLELSEYTAVEVRQKPREKRRDRPTRRGG